MSHQVRCFAASRSQSLTWRRCGRVIMMRTHQPGVWRIWRQLRPQARRLALSPWWVVRDMLLPSTDYFVSNNFWHVFIFRQSKKRNLFVKQAGINGFYHEGPDMSNR